MKRYRRECPVCKGKMVKAGMKKGEQNWKCKDCNTNTIYPIVNRHIKDDPKHQGFSIKRANRTKKQPEQPGDQGKLIE